LAFESQGRSVRITLSIGGAHNQLVEEPQYETLLSVAEGGLDVAIASGGDRYVHSELYEHFEKKHHRDRRRRTDVATEPPPPPEPGPARQIFALGATPPPRPAPAPAPAPERVREELPPLSPAERDELLLAQQREHKQEVENLERRISKLTAMLEKTEGDLRLMASVKAGDEGVASIYKTVQGLSEEETALELKKDLMQKIFEANMELKQAIARGST
jgi:hypothetical protein